MARWTWFQHENDARGDIKFQTAAEEIAEIQDCDHDIAALIAYAEYFQILEVMDTVPGWMLDISNPAIWRHLERSVMLQDGNLRRRVDIYLAHGLFDREFLEDCGKLSSESFVERSMEREKKSNEQKKRAQARWDKADK